MKITPILAAATLFAAPAFADGHETGDAEAGAKEFNKCKSCHMIVNTETEEVIVKGGKTGPNLYGVIGRQAGVVEGFKYGKSIVEAGEQGLVWDFDSFTTYVVDPRKFLQTTLDDKKARSKMAFKLRKGGDDIYAYLVSVGPVMEEAEGEAEATN